MDLVEYQSRYCREVLDLFHDTVHQVNAKDYTQEQLKVWAPEDPDVFQWDEKLSGQHVLLAVEEGRIIGFGGMHKDGYFDYLYVHKDHQAEGIGKMLADALEQWAAEQKNQILSVHASITAKPFFENRGYHVVKEQQVQKEDQKLTNFIMEKEL